MTTQTLTINFHGTNLYIVDQDGQPYTPMKTIVEGMGLDWASQFVKLKSNEKRWGIVKITIPTLGNMQEAICLPLRKLAGWLSTVSPNKVKSELRDTIIQYQNECDDVLWNHWTKEHVQYGLKQLPLQKTQKALPGCLTVETQDDIKQLINDRAARLPKDKQAGAVISLWSALGTHFGVKKQDGDKIPAYKRIPEGARLECLSLIARLSIDDLVTLTPAELAALVDEKVKAIDGELLEKETSPFMTDNTYRREAQKAFNDHFDSCHADMKQAGVTPPAWPVIDDKIIDGLAASMLWRTRWVMSFDNDQRMQLREMSNNDCVVDSRNSGQIESFINCLDLNMLHHVTDAIFARMIRQQDMAKNTNGTGKSQS